MKRVIFLKVQKIKNKKFIIIFCLSLLILTALLTCYFSFSCDNATEISTTADSKVSSSLHEDEKKDLNGSSEDIPAFNNKNATIDDSEKSVEPCKVTDFSGWNKSCDLNLLVINKDNAISDSYKFPLVDFNGKPINSEIMSPLESMINDAKKDNINIYVSSGYRSVERQTVLYNRKVSYFLKKGFSKAQAEIEVAKIVAKPKTSEHHTGLAIDFNSIKDSFCKTKEYDWLLKNSYKYGFILRYPKNKSDITNVIFEPWHFRYVGLENAKYIMENGICLEEFIAQKILQ